MRYFLAFILALLAGAAQAQPTPLVLPSCIPEQFGGSGKGLLSADTSAGVWRGYWCPTSDGKWVSWHHVVIGAFKTPTVNAALNTAFGMPTSLEGLRSFLSQISILPTSQADIDAYNALRIVRVVPLSP